MPNDQELARLVLERSLGTPQIPSTPGGEASPHAKKPLHLPYGPEIRQEELGSPFDLKKVLMERLGNIKPEPSYGRPTTFIDHIIQTLRSEHPEAMGHVKRISFQKYPDGLIGEQRGVQNQADLFIDPQQAVQFSHDLDPSGNLTTVLRHEIGHAVAYPDDYEDQPVVNGRYGRRPITGIPRDAQDIDEASRILLKK